MADIYAFGPGWALPAAVQDNIVSLIGSKTWVQSHVTSGTPMSSLTTGLHPIASSAVAVELDLPTVSAGWLEVLVLSDTQRRYTWYPSTTRTPWRNSVYNGTWTGWALGDTTWEKKTLLPSDDPKTLPESGIYFYFSGATATGHGMPINGVSTLENVIAGSTTRQIQRSIAGNQAYTRSRSGTTWTDWENLTPTTGAAAPTREMSRAGSTVKSVPLALTLSTGAATTTITGADVLRFPVQYGVDIPRFRVHARNWNRRTNDTYTGTVTVDGVYLSQGNTATGAPSGSATKVLGGFTTPANGAEYVSPWVEGPIPANTGHLLSVSVASSTGALSHPPASVFRTGGTWAATKDTAGTHATRAPLEWWIEAEVPARTPVIGFYGDSISSGTGAVQPVFNSWPSIYCRRAGALPMHWCVPGTGMREHIDTHPYSNHFWGVWDGYAAPDVAVNFTGQNDLLYATDLAAMQTYYQGVLPKIRQHISPVVHNLTLTPCELKTTAQQQTARDYNAWLKTRPMGERGVFDAAALLGNAGGTALLPQYDSGDKLHPNDAGYQALAAAFTYPITTPALATPITTTGGEKDTGWVQVSASEQGTAGKLWVRRVGDEVRLRVDSITINTATTHAGYVATLPAWAIPAGPEFFHTADIGSVTAWQRMGIYNTPGRDRLAWIQTAAASSTRPTTPMSGSHRYNTATAFPTAV